MSVFYYCLLFVDHKEQGASGRWVGCGYIFEFSNKNALFYAFYYEKRLVASSRVHRDRVRWRRQLWGTGAPAPRLTSNCFIFSADFRAHKLWHWTPCGYLPRKNIQADSFVTVYRMNFIIFRCVDLKLFSFSFMPLLARNPGDASGWMEDEGKVNDLPVYEVRWRLCQHAIIVEKYFIVSVTLLYPLLCCIRYSNNLYGNGLHRLHVVYRHFNGVLQWLMLYVTRNSLHCDQSI